MIDWDQAPQVEDPDLEDALLALGQLLSEDEVIRLAFGDPDEAAAILEERR